MADKNKQFARQISNHFFPNKNDGIFVEAGAYDGTCSVCEHLWSRGWTGVNVEANENLMYALNKKFPRCLNLNYALDNKNDMKTFYVSDKCPGWSSLKREHAVVYGEEKDSFEVECITYPQLIEIAEIKHIDFFVLDIEGNENELISTVEGDVLPELWMIEDNKADMEAIDGKLCGELNYTKLNERFQQNTFYELNNG